MSSSCWQACQAKSFMVWYAAAEVREEGRIGLHLALTRAHPLMRLWTKVPAFSRNLPLCPRMKGIQFSPGQKKANIHYADKQREARMIISCRGGKLGNSCSSLLMIHHLAYGSGYMPAIPMSSFCSIFILLCWDSFAASIGAAHCSQYPSLSDLAAPSSLKATHANFVVSEFTRMRCLVGRKGISDRGFDGHHRA